MCVLDAVNAFESTICVRDEELRINKAILPKELDQAAAKVAEVVENKCQADRPILRDIVRQEVNKTNKKKDREIKSLKAQLKQLKAKPSKKGGNNTFKHFPNGGSLA